jgi:hypothetical protein
MDKHWSALPFLPLFVTWNSHTRSEIVIIYVDDVVLLLTLRRNLTYSLTPK